MGIDVEALTVKREDAEVGEWVDMLQQKYLGVQLLVGRDKLDEVQGVRQKLQAFERFLEKHPEHHGKASTSLPPPLLTYLRAQVVLLQVALVTSEASEAHGRVDDIVARINSRFGTLTYEPVVFLHTQDLTFSQYLALLTVADAFIVTSLREGMALRAHEFVECQAGRHRPLILSEVRVYVGLVAPLLMFLVL
jgi:trehalose-6-phosphate synthase